MSRMRLMNSLNAGTDNRVMIWKRKLQETMILLPLSIEDLQVILIFRWGITKLNLKE
ncbi:hypothetical protein OROGR_000888 [Orobanche gracilis]